MHFSPAQLRRLLHPQEHSRLKRLVADLSLDTHMLSEALRNKVYSPPAVENWPPGFTGRFRSVACGPVASHSSVGPPGTDGVGPRINRRYGYGSVIWPMRARGLGICGFGSCCGARASG